MHTFSILARHQQRRALSCSLGLTWGLGRWFPRTFSHKVNIYRVWSSKIFPDWSGWRDIVLQRTTIIEANEANARSSLKDECHLVTSGWTMSRMTAKKANKPVFIHLHVLGNMMKATCENGRRAGHAIILEPFWVTLIRRATWISTFVDSKQTGCFCT